MAPLPTSVAPTSLNMSQALQSADWRQRLVCPVTPPKLRNALKQSTHSYLAFLNAVPEGAERAIANLAGPSIIPGCRTLIEAAFIAQVEMNGFARVCGRIPEVDYLTTGNDQGLSHKRWSAFTPFAPAKTTFAGLRRLKAPLNWAPVWRLPKCVFSSDAVISFNSHLVSELRRNGRAAASSNASQLLALARQGHALLLTEAPVEWVANAVAALTDIDQLGPQLRGRLEKLLAPIASAAFLQAANDLTALSRFSGLPRGLLSGTGAAYPSRAVGLEVMRRGGTVERYEHGGPLGMIASFEGMMLSDMTVSTHYVMMSELKIDLFNGLDATRLFPNLLNIELLSGRGDPHFAIPRKSASLSRRGKKKILYGPTVFRGHQPHEQPLLMDMVYLDWQIRLVEELGRIPAEVLLKPHPQNPSDAWHPQIADLCVISEVPFESLIPHADVIVCDYPQTTTFWASLCSDRPVILLDLGISPLNPALAEVFARRCTIIDASYDDNGIPRVHPGELRDAIHDLPDRADPAEIRNFFVAE